ncbi:hypothetical protein BDN72DRAFT_845027 [Pluteus cervinus]|uniref:Uncharacterized protein n=1 Tax=Pluteus cervinus TaxID=181527 RepID=A0ACD3AK65_9AGAR|nr:hypothetical protein BDN72DRAFT_845027 [Pluteus cervinus]
MRSNIFTFMLAAALATVASAHPVVVSSLDVRGVEEISGVVRDVATPENRRRDDDPPAPGVGGTSGPDWRRDADTPVDTSGVGGGGGGSTDWKRQDPPPPPGGSGQPDWKRDTGPPAPGGSQSDWKRDSTQPGAGDSNSDWLLDSAAPGPTGFGWKREHGRRGKPAPQ